MRSGEVQGSAQGGQAQIQQGDVPRSAHQRGGRIVSSIRGSGNATHLRRHHETLNPKHTKLYIFTPLTQFRTDKIFLLYSLVLHFFSIFSSFFIMFILFFYLFLFHFSSFFHFLHFSFSLFFFIFLFFSSCLLIFPIFFFLFLLHVSIFCIDFYKIIFDISLFYFYICYLFLFLLSGAQNARRDRLNGWRGMC